MRNFDYEKIIGKKIISVTGLDEGSKEIVFQTDCGLKFRMMHHQDCCECVFVDDVCGDESDLVGGIVIHFEERTSVGNSESECKPTKWSESFTWTFYDIQTTKGSVNIKWLGESNGYYSESVDFEVFI